MRKLDERCKTRFNMTFHEFMQEYYVSQGLSMVKCSQLLDVKPASIGDKCKKTNFNPITNINCQFCNKIFSARSQQTCCSQFCRDKVNWQKQKKTYNQYRKSRGKTRKIKAINEHGGRCTICGYNSLYGLCFHHIKPELKSFTIQNFRNSVTDIETELNKCSLLCHNCHFIYHEIDSLQNNKKSGPYYNRTRIGYKRKRELLDYFGNQCQKCGFKSHYFRCFSFHHLDPKIKSFELNIKNLSIYGKQKILEERNKCLLLCMNCHMELDNNPKIESSSLQGLNLSDEK